MTANLTANMIALNDGKVKPNESIFTILNGTEINDAVKSKLTKV